MDKLENPVWHSLDEVHSNFSVSYGNLKCYHPDFCPFGGYKGSNGLANQIDRYATLIDNFFIVGNKPAFSDSVTLKNELVCIQMVINKNIDVPIEEEVILLNGRYDNEAYDLITQVQPGYFKKKTLQLGEYCGIFKDGILVAVTGERMKWNDATEVSAVVTHPNYIGRGYAKQLVADRVNKIRSQSKTPFLHVTTNNLGAIQLYSKLGFEITREISFWNFVKN